MNPRPLFSARVAVLLAALAAILFSLTILLASREDPVAHSDARAGPGAFSTSSLGYAGLYDLLRELGWDVRRRAGTSDSDRNALLVFAEPGESFSPNDSFIAALPPKALVILPKWRGRRDPNQSKWIRGVELMPRSVPNTLLRAVDRGAAVGRSPWPGRWATNELGFAPSSANVAQLIVSGSLRPVVASESGILVGEIGMPGKTVWVLSDPDIMANHNLGAGDNAAFMLALFRRMAGGDASPPVVFDESVHGYHSRPTSPIRLLFEFPFVIATALACLAAVLLAWAGAARFTAPEQAGPPLGFGKERLIDGTARLMAYAGHQAPTLGRYVRAQIRIVAAALHAPEEPDDDRLAAWLDRATRGRSGGFSCREILGRLRRSGHVPDLLRCAADAHRWREAVLAAGPSGAGKAAGVRLAGGRRAGVSATH